MNRYRAGYRLPGKTLPISHKDRKGGARSYHFLLLLILIFAGIFLRLDGLRDSDMVIDEVTKVNAVEEYKSGRFWVNLEHPPMEKYLILASTSIFGVEDWSVKLPNLILGCFIPFLVFILLSRIGGSVWTGLIGAALTSLSPLMIGYSLIAKEDTLLNFLTVLGALFLLKAANIGASGEADIHEKEHHREPKSDPGSPIGTSIMGSLLRRLDPRGLTGTEIVLGIIIGISLASKYTMVFLLIAWSAYLFIVRKEFLKRTGPRIMAAAAITFTVLSWYYVNPYWLMLGIYHWMVESVGGHLTFFMGSSYQYPPLWFYPVVLLGRVHPLILFSSLGIILVSIGSFIRSFRRAGAHINMDRSESVGRASFLERTRRVMDKDQALWFLIFWAVALFIIMTVLPFKGVRYIQWIIVPLIGLAGIGIRRSSRLLKGRVWSLLVLMIVVLLMSLSIPHARPHYKEWSYVFNEDSGVKDYNGQGHREALEWIRDNGGGKVSMRWTELGEYYYGNVTEIVGSIDDVIENDVSYILLYIYDLQRDVHKDIEDLIGPLYFRLVHEVDHDSVTIIWIYSYDPAPII